MKTLYCWRCKKTLPMLEKREWKRFDSVYTACISAAKELTGQGKSKAEASACLQPALDKWFEMTDYRETDFWNLWHHQVEQYGKPCSKCGKPLRTPEASFCAACGEKR
jgi:predicted RNase H-like HicB family nuclease